MKLFKKLLALTLVLCMVFCLSSAVFAADDAEGDGGASGETTFVKGESDETIVKIKKNYTVTNKGTTAPVETFYLVQEGNTTVEDSILTVAEKLAETTANDGTKYVAKAEFATPTAFGDSDTSMTVTADFEITLPNYQQVGIYKYTLKEVDSKTPGVTYFDGNIVLVVTVINKGDGKIRVSAVHAESNYDKAGWTKKDKTGEITNNYNAGSLAISKTVTGNLGNKLDKYFEFKVKLEGTTGYTYADVTANETSWTSEDTEGTEVRNPTTLKIGQEYTFMLKHGETVTIPNIPYGVTYTVSETSYESEGYKTYINNSTAEQRSVSGKIGNDNISATVAFTNNKTGEVDMGVSLDSLPYILALAVAFGGAVVMITRKRHVED